MRRSRGGGSPAARRRAAVDQLADDLLEEADRRAGAHAAEARDPVRQAEDVEGIDRPERLEIAGDGAPERVRIAREPLREDRPLEDVERDAGHLERDVEHAAVGAPPPAPHQPLGRIRHGRHEPATVRGEKSGARVRRCSRHSSPSAVSEPVAEPRRQDPALQIVLAVVGGIVDEDVADRGRVVEHGHPAEHALPGDDRLLEMLLRPGGERIGARAGEELEEVRAASARGVGAGGRKRVS